MVEGMGLAPVAVLLERQCQDVGTGLVKLGIEMRRRVGCPVIIVLGHPEYYLRFGFERVPVYGIARYRDEFEDAI
jgi:putative acetyltransferase